MVTTPFGVIRPTWFRRRSFLMVVNQTLPSGPAVIASIAGKWSGNSVTLPSELIRPIWTGRLPFPDSVNQTLPSGPVVIVRGEPGVGNSVTLPLGAIRPI